MTGGFPPATVVSNTRKRTAANSYSTGDQDWVTGNRAGQTTPHLVARSCREPPGVALLWAFLAFLASVSNGWARRWVSPRDTNGTEEETSRHERVGKGVPPTIRERAQRAFISASKCCGCPFSGQQRPVKPVVRSIQSDARLQVPIGEISSVHHQFQVPDTLLLNEQHLFPQAQRAP